MRESLSEMVNNGTLSFEYFMKMHPFSATHKDVFRDALDGVSFFNDLYVNTIESYERLSQVCGVLQSNIKNLITVVGYRGSGKTNFLNYIAHIAGGGKINGMLGEQMKKLKGDDKKDRDADKKRTDKIKKNIVRYTNGAVKPGLITGQELNEHIQKVLKGHSEYVNFDYGITDSKKPLSEKYFDIFQRRMDWINKAGKQKEYLDLVDSFIARNGILIKDHFGKKKLNELQNTWTDVKVNLFAPVEDRAGELLKTLEAIPLLAFLLFYYISEFACYCVMNIDTKRKNIYLLDNLDMISDKSGEDFRKIIDKLFVYIHDSKTFFSALYTNSRNQTDQAFCGYYNSTNIVLALRETSSMKITGHYREIINDELESIDFSRELDKTDIIRKKLDLAQRLIKSNLITNETFINSVNNLELIMKDTILMRRIFMLNNNDVRTTIQLLARLCGEYDITPVPYQSTNMQFLFRGIVFKHIFEIFDEGAYFSDLQICRKTKVGSHPYSLARVLLVLLYKQREPQPDRILFNDAEYVELSELYNDLKGIIQQKDFVDLLSKMYSLQERDYWNHLITFDNVVEYSKKDLNKYLDADATEPEKIYVCITEAGKMFLDFVSIHYEYFSQRFCSEEPFLQSDWLSVEGRESLMQEIKTIYDAVEACFISLGKYNEKIMEILEKHHYNDIQTTQYYYEGQFHEERIISHHIQYLNAFRELLVNTLPKPYDQSSQELLRTVIEYIKKYLDLLHLPDGVVLDYRDSFISVSSVGLYNDLCVCIEEIDDNSPPKYDVDITRDYYREHHNGKKCRRNRGEKQWR